MIEYRGYATVGGGIQTLQGALVRAAEKAAYDKGYQAGRLAGYEEGMNDIRANQWGYVERLAREMARGTR